MAYTTQLNQPKQIHPITDPNKSTHTIQDPTTLAQQYGITRLLSLGAPPLMTPLPPAFESLHLDIADVPEVDLLALLPAILAFLRGDGRGLVRAFSCIQDRTVCDPRASIPTHIFSPA